MVKAAEKVDAFDCEITDRGSDDEISFIGQLQREVGLTVLSIWCGYRFGCENGMEISGIVA